MCVLFHFLFILRVFFFPPFTLPYCFVAGCTSAIGTQESTAHLLVSDPNLIHVLVKFLSGTSPHGTNQHSPQVVYFQLVI